MQRKRVRNPPDYGDGREVGGNGAGLYSLPHYDQSSPRGYEDYSRDRRSIIQEQPLSKRNRYPWDERAEYGYDAMRVNDHVAVGIGRERYGNSNGYGREDAWSGDRGRERERVRPDFEREREREVRDRVPLYRDR